MTSFSNPLKVGRISSSRLQAEARYKKRKHINEADLASQVKKLEAKNGATVYLIGTAHLSNASNYQVGKIIDQARFFAYTVNYHF